MLLVRVVFALGNLFQDPAKPYPHIRARYVDLGTRVQLARICYQIIGDAARMSGLNNPYVG